MVRVIALGQYARSRLWIAEMPPVECRALQLLTRSVPVATVGAADARRCAVELYWPTGPRALYGLLGAEFIPGTDSHLTVLVSAHDTQGETFEESLAVLLDDVRTGLPLEYAEAVNSVLSVEESSALQQFGPGTLTFAWGAHGAAGSARKVFEVLTSVLLKLLVTPLPLQDSEVSNLIRALLHPPQPADTSVGYGP